MHYKRAGAYFGLHFDFHADNVTAGIGTKTTAENVAKILDELKPDYIQVDTKGHPGYTSYASKHGYVASGLEKDHLKIIREETRKRGIALIAHHSGIFDVAAVQAHPEWAAVNPGDASAHQMRMAARCFVNCQKPWDLMS